MAHFLKKIKVRGVLSQDSKLHLAWHDLFPGLNSSMLRPVSDFALQESHLWELQQNLHPYSPWIVCYHLRDIPNRTLDFIYISNTKNAEMLHRLQLVALFLSGKERSIS